jgi:hypothetical protein
MDILDTLLVKINELGSQNNDITKYGDGFDDALAKVKSEIFALQEKSQQSKSPIDVSRRLDLDNISIELYSNDTDEDYRIDLYCSNNVAILDKQEAQTVCEYLEQSFKTITKQS